MTDLRQAAQQALEALESGLAFDTHSDVLQNLRTALEQQAEPMAWAVDGITQMFRGEFAELNAKSKARRIGGTCVAYPLYTVPPQRPWVGLKEEDWEHIDNKKGTSLDTFVQGATWAEVQLRERNT